MPNLSFPPSRVPSPQDAPSLRWGVVGPGWIAERFVDAVLRNTVQRVVAVASRSADRAASFAESHGIDRSFGSYAHVIEDPGVDVIYVSTPASEHKAVALDAIHSGKSVVIEKPFATTAADAREVFSAAKRQGVFAMEAMWMQYHPQTDIIRQLLDHGALGDVHLVAADHGQRLDDDRLFRPELGGGALLDLGIYPVTFAMSVLGTPSQVSALGTRTESGVDSDSCLVLRYAGGGMANLTTSLSARTPITASIAGSRASLQVHAPFMFPTGLTLTGTDLEARSAVWNDTGLKGFAGLAYEAAALARYHSEGRLESPIHTHAQTIGALEIIDAARHQIGAWFPHESRAGDVAHESSVSDVGQLSDTLGGELGGA